jgi:hypothetical protein
MCSLLRRVAVFTLLALGTAACVAEDEGGGTSVGDIKYQSARQAIDARVEVSGYYFNTALDIAGHRGERMEVRIYGDNGKLLGLAHATPRYDSSTWDKFPVFVPMDAMVGMSPDRGFDVYVVAPGDVNHYVSHGHYSKSNLTSPPIVWKWISYRDGVTLSNGERGMQIKLTLDIAGYKDRALQVYALVRDADLDELGADVGGPIRIRTQSIKPGYDDTHYSEVTLDVPYSRLAQVPPMWRVKVTPAIDTGNELLAGNIHFETWAGGSAGDVRGKVSDIVRGYDARADSLQGEIDHLEKEIHQ